MTNKAVRGRWLIFGTIIALGLTTAACSSNSPKAASSTSHHKRSHATTTTSSTSTTTTSTTSLPFLTTTTTTKPTPPLVALPNVIGQRIAPARAGLRAANLRVVYLTRSCNRGTLASQSVVIALGLPGPAPNYAVGARQLTPGDLIPKGTVVGIEWSGCFGGGTTVPNIVGQTFGAARSSLHQVGLTWTCSNTTNTTIPHDNIVLSQSPVPGSAVAANTIVAFVMNHCPAFAPK